MHLNRNLILPVVVAVLVPHLLLADEPLPPTAGWLPSETVVSMEISDPKPLFDRLMDPNALKAIEDSPVYQEQAKKQGVKEFLAGVGFLEASLGVSWQEAVRKLAGRGITVAAWPDKKFAIVIDGEDAQLLSRLHEIVVTIAKGEAAKQGKPERVASAEYRGVTGWTFNGEEAHAILGTRAVLTNSSKTLKEMIDLRESQGGSSLASSPSYKATGKAAGAANAAAYVNLDVLKQHGPFEKALKGPENPLLSLLLSSVIDSLRESNWLSLAAKVQGDTLSIATATDGKPTAKMVAFARPGSSDKGVLPLLDVPRSIASVSLYRDLHGFYAAKDELFPERTSGLIFFENMMGIFFSGRDLTDEVLAQAKPVVRIVVAEQAYDPAIGTPRVKIPAFAAVFQMKDPDKFMPVAEEGWQKALGLVNFTRGQQGLAGLIMDRPEHAGVKYSMAGFSTVDIEDKTALETRFNFRPALARVGDYLVISSTEGLTEDLIDALQKESAESPKPLPGVDSLVEVDAAAIASILETNREQFVRNSMVEKGKTQEEAEGEVGVLIEILRRLGQARLEIGSRQGLTQAELELKPNLP